MTEWTISVYRREERTFQLADRPRRAFAPLIFMRQVSMLLLTPYASIAVSGLIPFLAMDQAASFVMRRFPASQSASSPGPSSRAVRPPQDWGSPPCWARRPGPGPGETDRHAPLVRGPAVMVGPARTGRPATLRRRAPTHLRARVVDVRTHRPRRHRRTRPHRRPDPLPLEPALPHLRPAARGLPPRARQARSPVKAPIQVRRRPLPLVLARPGRATLDEFERATGPHRDSPHTLVPRTLLAAHRR